MTPAGTSSSPWTIAHPGHQGGRGRRGGGGQLHRAGVGGRGREGPQAHHQAHAVAQGQADHGVDELAPVEVGLGADQVEQTSAPASSWPERIWIWGQVSSVVTPSTMRATGRRARWSKKRSPSKVTSCSVGEPVSRAVMAVAAPSPASTQPSRATTSTGRSRAGSACDLVGRRHRAARVSAARRASRSTVSGNASTLVGSPAPAPAT